jgi:hypothetical protein
MYTWSTTKEKAMLSKEEATKFANENGQNIIVSRDAYMHNRYVVEFLPKEVVRSLFGRSATNKVVADSTEELCCKLEALVESFESYEDEEGGLVEPHIKDGFVMGYSKTEYAPKGIRPIPFAKKNIEAVTNEIMFLIDCLC